MQAFWLLFYGSAAAFALWATWRDEDLRWLGGTLCFSFVISNLVWFLGSVSQRPGIYTMLEVFVAVCAYVAWHRHPSKSLIAVVMLATLSICANIGFAITYEDHGPQTRGHEITTNLIFLFECLLTAGVGIMDGFRTGRFRRRASNGEAASQSHVAGEAE
ncbi:hypothetical protein IC614_03100 [Allosphingosinicella flava]|uniref:Uncharacterized protein n=1 Tax=Allosphingosinicella flava TaxID=2771430 RepID=A0A7T2GKM6_9SPHN|nr:hypothetical protein [Sphingosinicella flava]QPQ55604.1 hypothetical protein IC614_03100 [Sphingosinicella flava]